MNATVDLQLPSKVVYIGYIINSEGFNKVKEIFKQ